MIVDRWHPPRVCIESSGPDFDEAAARLARRLGLCDAGDADFALQLGEGGLHLVELGPRAPGPIRVDFVGGAVGHRRQFGGGSGQMIAKAVGIRPRLRPSVLDATAGLGRDAFVLASLGCEVALIERQPLIAALLEDGLRRAARDAEAGAIVARMRLIEGDAIALMESWPGEPPQVVYLDPMFPHRDKSALVKKEMRLFRSLVGDDVDGPALLARALALASHRVAVKRPRRAPPLGRGSPTFAVDGQSSRFDVYVRRSFKAG